MMKISKKMFVLLAVVFVVGFALGLLTEHVIHELQAKKHGGGNSHCADGHVDEACSAH